MSLQSLDHINIHTENLDALAAWYERVLDLKTGSRPAFGSDGWWLFLGDKPIVHLIAADTVERVANPALEHFALSASGLGDFLAKMNATQTAYRLIEVPDVAMVQVSIADCDGNHIHIDFPLAKLRTIQ